jgi:hypothetical protein
MINRKMYNKIEKLLPVLIKSMHNMNKLCIFCFDDIQVPRKARLGVNKPIAENTRIDPTKLKDTYNLVKAKESFIKMSRSNLWIK